MTAKKTKLIVTLAQHEVLGMLFMPYGAEDMPDGTMRITDPGNRIPPHIVSKLSEVERQIIEISAKYAERNLMKTFSKETIIHVFYRKLTEDHFKKVIRPYIDKKLVEMLDVMRTHDIPLYENEKGNKVLYAHNKVDIAPHYTDAHFDFEVDNKNFHYSLQCSRNGEPVDLLEKKPVIVLTSSPATLLLGNELHAFQDISSMRILPFTNKIRVSVSASETDKYMEKIVLPILRNHDITFSGLRIFEEERPFEAILSVEENVYDTTVLKLSFHYGDDTFYPGSARARKPVSMQTDEDGRVSLRYYHRDPEKEDRLVHLLKDAHLSLVGDSHFKLRDDAPEKEMTDWIIAHREMLAQEFGMLSGVNDTTYCLDEIRIEQEMTEKQDWFELHITAIIGEFRIPFHPENPIRWPLCRKNFFMEISASHGFKTQ